MKKGKKQGIEAAKGQFLLYKAEDGKIKIDVRLEDGKHSVNPVKVAGKPVFL